MRIVALLRSQTGKVHFAAASGGTSCNVRAGELHAFDGGFADVTCALCARLVPRGDAGPASPQPAPWGSRSPTPSPPSAPSNGTTATSTSTSVVAPVDAPDPRETGDPFAVVRRAVFPLSFAALGSVAAIWLVRRRRR